MRFMSQGMCGATLLLAAGGAAAQSSVTLYGVADTFVQYLDNGGKHSYSVRSGGSTGSLFGLKGVEDLGNGLKAVFDLENGYNINNGAFFADSTAMFYRQSWVGLKHDTYGSLTFGRQYQPSFWAVYFTDPFRGNEVLSPLAAADLAGATDRSTLATQYVSGRTSNSIVYTSPDLRGVHVYAMYALPATVTQPVPVRSGAMLDLAANYSGYGFYAGVGYQYQHGAQETAPLVASAPGLLTTFDLMATEHFTGALAYRVGIVNFQFNYSYNRPKDPPPGAVVAITPAVQVPLASLVHSYSIMELGATIQATPEDVIAIAGIERNVRGVHDNTPGIEVGVDHSLSKRTSLYMRAGYLKNNGTANMSWPGVTAVASGSKQVLAVLGMTHRF
ncbi:porin [Caballeronia sp. EK]|uniref:porin n=1 Tax=Caballeronia sp. EK TaxID=2767469 RepID=UPI0016565B97|nr:porin [Caballeronia sp. EK]MBC8635675.1 porin [Caballeronia sp. EK]